MKVLNVAAIVAAVALSAVAISQGPGRGPGGPGGGMRGGPGGPGGPGGGFRQRSPQEMADRTSQMLTQFLGLTPAQTAKVKAIILKNQTAIKKLRDAQDAEIKKVLTPAQAKKMTSMPRGGMRGGPGGGGPGGPGGGRGRG